GGLVRPDPTPWANDQVLEIKDQPPGFQCRFLDGPMFDTPIPVHRVLVSGDTVRFERFNGHNEIVPEPVETIVGSAQPTVVTKRFLLGTDGFGRDVLSRLMAGTVVSLSVGLIAVLISLLIGIPLGALAGYFR